VAVPVWLKLRFGVLEVISTLLLNFVAESLVSLMVQGPLQESQHIYPQSDPIAEVARLPVLPGTRLHAGLVLALLMSSTLVVVSYATTMLGPSNSSLTIRSFEWLRDHGAAGFATSIETIYYSLNAPATGGPALRKLPLRPRPSVASIHPPNVAPLISPVLRGEGVWVPAETWSGGDSPVQIAQFRSDPSYPQMVAGVVPLAGAVPLV